MKKHYLVIVSFLIISLLSCRKDADIVSLDQLSGGNNGTVFDDSKNAFGYQMPGISEDEGLLFFVGNSFFNQNWVSAPASAKARDGLGPLLNAKSCSSCHFKDGRGKPVEVTGQFSNGFLIRLSVPGTDEHGGPLGEPIYGGQFSDMSIQGINKEGDIEVEYLYITGTYDDGTTYELRKPIYTLTNLNYGDMANNVMMTARIGQQMIGLGLLEAIGESGILAHQDINDANGDGVSGKPNYVWDVKSQSVQLGIFGWKANQPSLLQQVAGAFQGDLGIKSYLFTSENHTQNQTECLDLDDGGEIEIDEDDLMKTVLYSSSLAVPARRHISDKSVIEGEALFDQLNCVACHVKTYTTGNSHNLTYLNNQVIHPYSDLLLHDMGDGLADNRPDYLATGNEWRTQPLWGIGLIETVNGHTNFLHDGRARNIEEAILWHGGEAENSVNKFKALTKTQRQAVIDFVNSL